MSTYVRALSPAKTEAGSDASLFQLRPSSLRQGGKQSGLTLFRHRSAIACTSVRVRACQFVSAVQVHAYLRKQPPQSNKHVKGQKNANARNIHLKYCRHALHFKTSQHMSLL
jgi:hypothetical protein